jgi:hypothetical protein
LGGFGECGGERFSTATAVEVMVDGDRGAGSGRHGLGVGGVFASSTR